MLQVHESSCKINGTKTPIDCDCYLSRIPVGTLTASTPQPQAAAADLRTKLAIELRRLAKRENPGAGRWDSVGEVSKEHWRSEADKILALLASAAPVPPLPDTKGASLETLRSKIVMVAALIHADDCESKDKHTHRCNEAHEALGMFDEFTAGPQASRGDRGANIWAYGIIDKDGNAHMSEVSVCRDEDPLWDEARDADETYPDKAPFRVVPLYAEAPKAPAPSAPPNWRTMITTWRDRGSISYIEAHEALGLAASIPAEWWCESCGGFRPATYQLKDLVCSCGHVIATVQFSGLEAPEETPNGSAPAPAPAEVK